MPNILYVILEQIFFPAMFIETISFLLTLVTAAAVECEYSYRTEWLVLELPLIFIVMGAVVAKWSGHQPGNRKVPGSMPGIDPRLLLALCFLGQETYPSPSHPAANWEIL